MVQWSRTHLPMQGMGFNPRSGRGTRNQDAAHAPQLESPSSETTKPVHSRARTPQLEEPPHTTTKSQQSQNKIKMKKNVLEKFCGKRANKWDGS